MLNGKKPHLSTLEIAQLNTILEETGIRDLLHFIGSKIAHEAHDDHWANQARATLAKIGNQTTAAFSRFVDTGTTTMGLMFATMANYKMIRHADGTCSTQIFKTEWILGPLPPQVDAELRKALGIRAAELKRHADAEDQMMRDIVALSD